jgi:hypothetical protein
MSELLVLVRFQKNTQTTDCTRLAILCIASATWKSFT